MNLNIILRGVGLACIANPLSISAQERPNILFVITDQQFADAISYRMGTELLRTPAMDSIAAQGVVFSNAFSSNPISVPARNSMFTGMYSHQTGITRNTKVNDPKPQSYKSSLKNLGQYFNEAGYQTAYFGKSHLMFDINSVVESGFQWAAESHNDSVVSVDAVNFLKNKTQKPFFLVASFTNPHNICEYARNLVGRNQALSCGEIGFPSSDAVLPELPANLGNQINEPDALNSIKKAYQVDDGLFPVSNYSPLDWRKLRWGYYRMIEMVDAQLALIINELKKQDLYKNTVIVFTSDHGEMAGAHGWNQKTVFYEESVHVPLIISYPAKLKHLNRQELVNIGVDLLPTFLDFAGLDIPRILPGRSLKSLTQSKEVENWPKYVFAQNLMAQAKGLVNGEVLELNGRMVRSVNFKYCIYDKGDSRESLVDLINDPGEMINLAGNVKYQQVLQEYRKQLSDFALQQNDTLALYLLNAN